MWHHRAGAGSMAGMSDVQWESGRRGGGRAYATGRWTFLRRFLVDPKVVGALCPSSGRLARALLAPFRERTGPASVLEVGAGTGAVTRHIGEEMGSGDRLAVCEIQPALADHLERELLSRPPFETAFREGRVELLRCAMQKLDRTPRFDYIICGLPFTAFDPEDVRTALAVIRSVLRPGGVFAYFEYVGLRRIRKAGSVGGGRRKRAAVSGILDDHIRRFEIGRKTVLRNVPPAYARYWRFDSAGGD